MNRFDFVSNQFVDGYITGLMNKEMKDPNSFAEGGSLGDENYKYSNPFEYGQKLAMAHKFGTGSDSSNPFEVDEDQDVFMGRQELPNPKPYYYNQWVTGNWERDRLNSENNTELPALQKPFAQPNVSTDIRSLTNKYLGNKTTDTEAAHGYGYSNNPNYTSANKSGQYRLTGAGFVNMYPNTQAAKNIQKMPNWQNQIIPADFWYDEGWEKYANPNYAGNVHDVESTKGKKNLVYYDPSSLPSLQEAGKVSPYVKQWQNGNTVNNPAFYDMYKNYVSPEEVKDMEDGVYDDSFNNLSSEEAKKAEEAAKAEEAKKATDTSTDAELKRRDNPISAWETNLRYAPAVADAWAVASDALGFSNKPDYQYANHLIDYANRYPQVTYQPIGGYRHEHPVDRNVYLNMELANQAAKRRAAVDTANGSRATAFAQTNAVNYGANNAMGDLIGKIEAINQADRESVARHNNEIDKTNASAYNDISKQNAANYLNHLAYIDRAMEMKQTQDQTSAIAKAANISNFAKDLGLIGKERMSMNMINSDLTKYYMIKPDGSIVYANEYFGLSPQMQSAVNNDAVNKLNDKVALEKENAEKKSKDLENSKIQISKDELERFNLKVVTDENGNKRIMPK